MEKGERWRKVRDGEKREMEKGVRWRKERDGEG